MLRTIFTCSILFAIHTSCSAQHSLQILSRQPNLENNFFQRHSTLFWEENIKKDKDHKTISDLCRIQEQLQRDIKYHTGLTRIKTVYTALFLFGAVISIAHSEEIPLLILPTLSCLFLFLATMSQLIDKDMPHLSRLKGLQKSIDTLASSLCMLKQKIVPNILLQLRTPNKTFKQWLKNNSSDKQECKKIITNFNNAWQEIDNQKT